MNKADLDKTARFILNSEARRDSKGRLKVYPLPDGDGGGTFEVAGINDKYDHDVAYELKAMLKNEDFEGAERRALDYYIENTNSVLKWPMEMAPAIEAYLRDVVFNRGAKGAARTLQIAIGVVDDGQIGPRTLEAYNHQKFHPEAFLNSLRMASEVYERIVAPPIGKRAKFWNGLVNRWNNRLEFCKTLL